MLFLSFPKNELTCKVQLFYFNKGKVFNNILQQTEDVKMLDPAPTVCNVPPQIPSIGCFSTQLVNTESMAVKNITGKMTLPAHTHKKKKEKRNHR